jgi:hypothetical protein
MVVCANVLKTHIDKHKKEHANVKEAQIDKHKK